MSKKVRSNEEISNSSEYNILKADELLATIKPRTELEIAQDRALQLGYEVVALREQIEKLLSDNMHLKKLLEGVVPVIGEASPLAVSDEELIATVQLQKLKEAALARELTKDEVQKYDLLVKNKNLSQGKATDISGKDNKKSLKGKPVSELMRIAKLPIKE